MDLDVQAPGVARGKGVGQAGGVGLAGEYPDGGEIEVGAGQESRQVEGFEVHLFDQDGQPCELVVDHGASSRMRLR